MEQQINANFIGYKLNEEGTARSYEMAQRFSDLITWMKSPGICVEGREFSLAITKLEEASFYAKRALSINLVNQQS